MESNGSPAIEERSIGELVATATHDLSLLVHKEIELAKAEVAIEAKRIGVAGGLFGGAGIFGLYASLFLSVAAAFGISALGISLGYGFLCVGGGYLLAAGALGAFGGLKLVRVRRPERTIRTVTDSLAWVRHPTVAPDRELEEIRSRHAE